MIFFFLFLLLLLWWWWWSSFPFVFLCGVGGYLCIQDGCQLQAVAASHWCRLEDSLAMQKLLDAVHSTYSSLLPPYPPPPPPLYSSSSPSPSPSRLLHEKSSLEEGQGAGGGSECYDDRHSFPLLFFSPFFSDLSDLSERFWLSCLLLWLPPPPPPHSDSVSKRKHPTNSTTKQKTHRNWRIEMNHSLFIYIYIFKKFETKKNQETKKRNDNNQTFHPSAM